MPNAAVVTVSDRCFQGLRPDEGGPLVAEMLTDAGYTVTETGLALPCGATGRWCAE